MDENNNMGAVDVRWLQLVVFRFDRYNVDSITSAGSNRLPRYEERRFRAGAYGGRGGRVDAGTAAVSTSGFTAAGTVESHNVHERGVRAGNQRDQSDHDDGHVFGHGPTAHALPAARRPAAAPPPLRPVLHAAVQIRVVAHRVVVPVKIVQIVLGVRVAVVFLAVPVAVLPEREQVDDGRAHETQDGEEHGTDERDERRQVGHERGDEHCARDRKKNEKS